MRGCVQSRCELGDLRRDSRGVQRMNEVLVPLLQQLALSFDCISQKSPNGPHLLAPS